MYYNLSIKNRQPALEWYKEGVNKMSKKTDKEEFLNRFYRNYPKAKIELLEYTAISKPAIIKCQYCGKILKKNVARHFFFTFNCCHSTDETKIEKLKRLYENSDGEYSIVKLLKKQKVIIRHNKCGTEQTRVINSCLDNPYSCKYCETRINKLKNNQEDIQQELDKLFFGAIELLEYNGYELKNKYRCKKCGFIFEQKHVCLRQSRGCPKCDRYISKGERMMEELLQHKNIKYQKQVSVEELPLQHFDFAFYDDNNNLLGYIEINGEQHYFDKTVIFRDSLEKIQERDERKRKYCKEQNIPLYEIKYLKGEFKNLEILPF